MESGNGIPVFVDRIEIILLRMNYEMSRTFFRVGPYERWRVRTQITGVLVEQKLINGIGRVSVWHKSKSVALVGLDAVSVNFGVQPDHLLSDRAICFDPM